MKNECQSKGCGRTATHEERGQAGPLRFCPECAAEWLAEGEAAGIDHLLRVVALADAPRADAVEPARCPACTEPIVCDVAMDGLVSSECGCEAWWNVGQACTDAHVAAAVGAGACACCGYSHESGAGC
jgi:hypothetical protein